MTEDYDIDAKDDDMNEEDSEDEICVEVPKAFKDFFDENKMLMALAVFFILLLCLAFALHIREINACNAYYQEMIRQMKINISSSVWAW